MVLLAKIKENIHMDFRLFRTTISLNIYNQINANDLIAFVKNNLSYSPIFVFTDNYMVPMNIIGFAYFNFVGAFENHWDNISLIVKDKQDRKKLLEFLKPHLKGEQ